MDLRGGLAMAKEKKVALCQKCGGKMNVRKEWVSRSTKDEIWECTSCGDVITREMDITVRQ